MSAPGYADAILGSLIERLHADGPKDIPARALERVLDAEWAILSDQATGFAYFWLHYAMIYIKGGTNRGWHRACPGGHPRVESNGRSWAWQLLVCLKVVTYEELLVLKNRQIGWSLLFGNLIVWACMFARETNVAVISNKLQSAWRNMKRARACYRALPEWMRLRVPLTNPAVSHLEFANGSVAEPYSGDPDAARSEGAAWVLVDEVGEIKALDDWYAATESVAGEGCHLIMAGTAKNNGLEAWCIDCDAGDLLEQIAVPDLDVTLEIREDEGHRAFLFLPYFIHPNRAGDWKERKKLRYKGNIANLDREYPGTWQEAFQAVGGRYFDVDALKAQVTMQRSIFEARDRRGTLLGWGDKVEFHEDPGGLVVIHATDEEFRFLLSTGRPFSVGADCAGDRASGDFHAASGVQKGKVPSSDEFEAVMDPADIIPYRQLLTIHGYADGDHYADLLCRAGFFLGEALLVVEDNGVGAAVLKRCYKVHHYPNLYRRRTDPKDRADKATQTLGYLTNNATKHASYGESERLLRNGWLDVRDVATCGEMADVINLGASGIGARDPKHDDRPDGLTMAVAGCPYAHRFKGFIVDSAPRPAYYSPDEILRRMDERKAVSTVIGNEMYAGRGL